MLKTNLYNYFFAALFLTVLFPLNLSAQCFPDITKPVARCKNVTVYLDSTGQAGVNPLQVDGGSYDNCSEWYLILNHPCFYCSDIGTVPITLYVQDRARNQSTCTAYVTVRDTSRPKLTVRSNITVIFSDKNTPVPVTAQQLVASVTDNCSALNKIQLGLRKVGTGTGFPTTNSLSFTCADTGKVTVEVWAKDSVGNTISRTTILTISDNNKVCAPRVIQNLAIIGKINTENGKAIPAQVTLNGGNAQIPVTLKSSTYNFQNILRGTNYSITALRDSDWISGVTTFDIALMSRHALDLEPLTSPYKLIAGDVDKDGYVDATDMLLTRRLVLKLIPRINNNTAWRFVPKSHVFVPPFNAVPTGFPEVLTYSNLTDTVRDADLVAIKTGDVNQSANGFAADNPSLQTRNLRNWTLITNDKQFETGQTHALEFTQETIAEILAFQFTLNYDKHLLKIVDIQSLDLQGFDVSNYAHFEDKGMVTVSWNGTNKLSSNGNKLFRVIFQALKPTRLSEVLLLTSDLTHAEAYDVKGENFDVKLHFKGENTEGGNLVLFPNAPNPFSDATTIRFRLPQESAVKLTVFDETGRVLTTLNRVFAKGYNEWILTKDDMTASGVLFYRLNTPTHSAVQRMVILKQ